MDATKLRDGAHCRIYYSWLTLPTWRALSPPARALLVEILARYRPADDGCFAWSVRRAADVLRVSKSTAARCLLECERNGWLSVAKASSFGGRANASTYRLSMYPCEATSEPASKAYEHLPGEQLWAERKAGPRRQSRREDKPVLPTGRDGVMGGTRQSRAEDMVESDDAPVSLSDALRKSRIFATNAKGKAR